ncbi:cytochrome c biogenesis protein ResB [Paenibacillus sp. IB182496]|uniref:Cytochrome c biogenesis protein ResB n=1 Tax=Paenibacillus sabuli TaxID=2772509 RepID=A0A927BUY2_9BACL|nr:cytochrome c biogenesis protein ResB [Paenibacillus sabuli]MBD2846802.1 cytochrome c biogenesis protein ResB [Paenibacillus sabuli]
MFQNTKCECGHQNHVGTVLCESCGKPLMQETLVTDEPLEMRYDGVARRSQKANPNLIDRIWNFFSSVKIAVYLIVITFVGASLGTIYPQESTFISGDFSTYYEDNYGTPGKIYQALGLSHTYESWWFITLLVMIGTSLVICSLDRVLPLYRALKKQQIRKHLSFIKRQRVAYEAVVDQPGAFVDRLAEQLKRKRYRVHKDKDGLALLAEKNRFSRWGPYINHIGLIVFLLAVLARGVPAWHMDSYITAPHGEAVPIPDTNYYLKNEQFTVDYYADDELPEALKGTMRAKKYETQAVLYACTASCDDPAAEPELTELKRHDILVNHPLEYEGMSIYQFDFDDTPKLKAVRPVLVDKQTGERYGPFELSMTEPETSYALGPYTLELRQQFMEFAIGDDGNPTTLSREPNAPAFFFLLKGPGLDEAGETYLYFPREVDKLRFSQDRINGDIADRFEIIVGTMENVELTEPTSFLNVRVDKAMPYVWVGAGISMLGLVLGFYWQHRRVWLRFDADRLSLGAHTNKNWYGMRGDVASAMQHAGITVEPKSLDNGGKNL